MLRRTVSGLCAKTLHASYLWLLFSMFQKKLGPLWPNAETSGIKGPQTKTGKRKICTHFLNFLVPLSGFRRHHVNIPWKSAKSYAISSENPIQEFSLPYNQQVRLEFVETKCAEFGTVAKLRLSSFSGRQCMKLLFLRVFWRLPWFQLLELFTSFCRLPSWFFMIL